MKKGLFILFSISLIFIFSSTEAQKKKQYLTGADIPTQITTYIDKYFPQHQITKVKEEVDFLDTEYEVKLSPKVELEFDEDFVLTEIESKSGIPQNTLPEKVNNYLKQHYPNQTIIEWKKKCKGQKIKLDNNNKLYFGLEGDFRGVKKH